MSTIDRQAAINEIEHHIRTAEQPYQLTDADRIMNHAFEIAASCIYNLPSAQPFHNITMNDVLKYIDNMPEDVWQEFTACLECRGWELKWCGGDFA